MWNKTPNGWVKLNTDGSSIGNLGSAGRGGLIRDQNGIWITGFSQNVGIATSMETKLWAPKDGLSVCRELNLFSC